MAFLSLSRRGLLSLALVALASLPAAAQRETGTITTAQGTSTTCVTRGVGQSCVRTNVPGNVGSLTVQVTGSGTYTLQFEVSSDGGATWYQPGGVNLSSYARESSTTGAGRWAFGNSGITHLQVRASAYTSGTPAVVITGGAGGITAPLSAGSISGGNDAAGTIGAAVPGSGSYTAVNIGGNLTGWTGLTVGSVNAGAMALVDASGNQITSFGGGTQYAVDAALGATPTGTLAVAIRDDALSALTPVEGDAIGLRVDANGALWVIPSGTTTISGTVTANLSAIDNAVLDDIADGIAVTNAGTFATQAAQSGTWTVQPGNTANTTPWLTSISQGGNTAAVNASGQLSITCANCSGSGASSVDDAAFTVASDSGAVAMGLLDDVTPDSVNEGDAGAVRMSANRNLYVQIRDAAGNERGLNVDANGAIAVTGSFSVGLADDADFTAGTTTFSPVGGFYQSSVTACTDGDTCAAGITTGRAIKVALSNADGTLATYQTDATFGTTTYTETSSTGPLVGAVRNDTLATLANTDNEIAPLQVNADGALYVAVSNTSLTVTATNLDVQSGGADLATATQAGAIQTAVELIDNAIGVEDAAETAGGGLAMAGTVRRDTAATSAGAAGDNATLNTDALGRLWTTNGGPCADPARITHAAISESTAATNEIVALNGSDLIYVCSYKWVVAGATTLKWVRGTGTDCGTGTTDIEGAQSYAANGGVTEQGGGAPLFVVAAGNALCLTAGSAVAQGGRVSYVRTATP